MKLNSSRELRQKTEDLFRAKWLTLPEAKSLLKDNLLKQLLVRNLCLEKWSLWSETVFYTNGLFFYFGSIFLIELEKWNLSLALQIKAEGLSQDKLLILKVNQMSELSNENSNVQDKIWLFVRSFKPASHNDFVFKSWTNFHTGTSLLHRYL